MKKLQAVTLALKAIEAPPPKDAEVFFEVEVGTVKWRDYSAPARRMSVDYLEIPGLRRVPAEHRIDAYLVDGVLRLAQSFAKGRKEAAYHMFWVKVPRTCESPINDGEPEI